MMATLNDTKLKQLIKGGETATVEFKVNSPRPSEMAERLCGMANARGGLIIIGVRDSDHEIIGVSDDRLALTIDVIMRATRQIIKPGLVLNPLEPEIYTVDGKQLVVATVPPNNGPIYQAGGVCWVRRGTQTVPLSVDEMLEIAGDRGLYSWERQPAHNATIDDIDIEKVEAFLARRSQRSHQGGRFQDIERVLIGMNCAVKTGAGRVVPTNAGILFFGYDPQMHVIQAEVVCVLFRGATGTSRYTDMKIMRGTIVELVDKTEDFLQRYIPVEGRVEGWKRIDIPDYPIEALREAVINAVIHRDYSRQGESIRVFYYEDRIEVHSPGLLLPDITVEMMERGEVMSKLRNPVLAGLLRDVPGYMERMGSGIRFMLDEAKRLGLPAVQFREIGEFVVTFYKTPSAQEKKQPPLEGMLWDESELQQPALEVPSDNEDRLTKAVLYVQEHGFITSRLHSQLTGVSTNTGLRDLEILVERGRLKRVGTKRWRRYELP